MKRFEEIGNEMKSGIRNKVTSWVLPFTKFQRDNTKLPFSLYLE